MALPMRGDLGRVEISLRIPWAGLLPALPKASWWSVCLAFAFKRMDVRGEDAAVLGVPVMQGLDAFERLFHTHLA